jgi:predicted NBD/HSP70 family sugar kinase/DNA-binding XRE family transcriptional regulator
VGDPTSPSDLRASNRERLLQLLRSQGAMTQAQLARASGLSPATVSSIARELRDEGWLEAVGTGGKRSALSLSRAAGVAVGIDFDHSHVRVAIADLAHSILAEASEPLDVDHEAEEGIGLAGKMVRELLHDVGVSHERVTGVGMGLPGPLRRDTGEIGDSAILPGWIGAKPEEMMSEELGLPVRVENDANLGALAELGWGAGYGAQDLIFVSVRSGIGAALVIDGRLYRGAGGTAGELGHTLFRENGEVCRCGNRGCLETVAATGALVDLLRRSHGEDLTTEAMLEAARSGDLGCRRVIHDAGRALGQVVATLLNVLNPELLVVGGDLAGAGNLLLDGVRESIGRAALPEAARRAKIVAGVLGDRAQVLGALALVVSEADRTFPTRLVPS